MIVSVRMSLHSILTHRRKMWDARDALGNKVSSGIYFARARAGGYDTAIKLLYLK